MLKILVTGASGWVGRAALDYLELRGDCVPVAGVRQAQDLPYEQCVLGDLANTAASPLNLQGVAVVIHCAGRAHVMHETAENPLALFRQVNVEGPRALLAAAAKAGVRHFVYVSSIKVNGEQSPLERGFNEADAAQPEDAYGLSKWEAEQLVQHFCEQQGMEWVIVRPPLVYGVGVKANFLQLMRLLRRRLPLPLGALHNRRSMVALDNLVDFLCTCARHPKAANQLFLISDGEDLSLTQTCSVLAAHAGSKPWLIPVPASILKWSLSLLGRRAAADRLCGELRVDIQKSQQLLSWHAPLSANQALAKTAQSFVE